MIALLIISLIDANSIDPQMNLTASNLLRKLSAVRDILLFSMFVGEVTHREIILVLIRFEMLYTL